MTGDVSGRPGGPAPRICGEYVDRKGDRWFCGERYYDDGRVSIECNGVDHPYRTWADRETFAAWGWTLCASLSPREPK